MRERLWLKAQTINCLGRHFVAECPSKFNCRTCKERHHTSLHFDRPVEQQSGVTSGATFNGPSVFLSTAIDDTIIDPPTASEALQIIQKLRLFFGEDAELNKLDFREAFVKKNRNFRQDKMNDYFVIKEKMKTLEMLFDIGFFALLGYSV